MEAAVFFFTGYDPEGEPLKKQFIYRFNEATDALLDRDGFLEAIMVGLRAVKQGRADWQKEVKAAESALSEAERAAIAENLQVYMGPDRHDRGPSKPRTYSPRSHLKKLPSAALFEQRMEAGDFDGLKPMERDGGRDEPIKGLVKRAEAEVAI